MAKTFEPRIQSHAGDGPRPGILVDATQRPQQVPVLPNLARSRPCIYWPAVAVAAGCAMLLLAGLVVALSLATRAERVAQGKGVEEPTNSGQPEGSPPWAYDGGLPPGRCDGFERGPVHSQEGMTTTQPSAAVVASVERNTLERALAKPSAVLAPPQPAEEGKKERTETSAPRVFKQRKHRSPDELARELLAMPELTLDSVPGTSNKLVVSSRQPASQPSHAAPDFMVKRTDLAGLPFRMGLDCQIGKESAENLQVLSRKLRGYLAEAMPKDGIDIRLDADVLRAKLLKGKDGARGEWLQPEAVPALVQLLQAEDRPIRLLLVEVLSMNKDPSATAALAQRALFDLSCDVREAATQALKDRPRAEYQPLLLEVLRYPWAPVADHAAETLAYLGDGDVMPSLVKLLDDPDPTAPIVKIGKSQLSMVREVVRVNHLRNCLMCHAASSNPNDPVRGLIPTPGQPLPPGFTPAYYQGNGGLFVRADVTYLKQDFSVPQPVVRAEAWPVNQRNDYLVRTRLATAQEVAAQPKKPADYPQRDAVLFALRELTGKDAGPTSAGWRQLMAQAMVAKIKE